MTRFAPVSKRRPAAGTGPHATAVVVGGATRGEEGMLNEPSDERAVVVPAPPPRVVTLPEA
jgi:hypothetical protein